jgi:hypothetical protein
MRVLSLLAVVLAGCYDPAIRDCQFTCPEGQCPGDLACVAGVCRIPGASGSCPCPAPPSGCSLVTNSASICLASCTTAHTWDDALAACAASASWQLAVLDTASTLSAGEGALRSSTTWIGLHRSSMLDSWTWIGGGGSPAASDWTLGPTHNEATYTCAAIDSGKLYSDACGTPHPYACTLN